MMSKGNQLYKDLKELDKIIALKQLELEALERSKPNVIAVKWDIIARHKIELQMLREGREAILIEMDEEWKKSKEK